MSDFYALLTRMKNIERWALMRCNVKENVLEHTAIVAFISHSLGMINNKIFSGNIDSNLLVTISLFHESSEVLTGDLPTPIKYYNNSINNAYKQLENLANEKLIGSLPPEFRDDYSTILNYDKDTYEYKLCKSADKIAAYIKSAEEVKSGNSEFNNAKETLYKSIKSIELPEVKYFIKNFLPSFLKDLDNITL